MPNFIYKAKQGLETTLEGSIEAENQEEALNRLIKRGLFPIVIHPETTVEKTSKKKSSRERFLVRRRVTSNEILVLAQKLATLIRANVDLLSSLRILYEQTESPALQKVILEILIATKEGNTFSESLERFPNLFSPLFVNLIKSGEVSGRLDSSLEQLNEFLSREETLRIKISVALAYPALLLMVGLTSIFILLTFVVPKLRPIFEGVGRELPTITKVILSISAFSSKNWLWGIAVISFFFLVLRYWLGEAFLKQFTKKIKMYTPVVNRLVKNQGLAHFSRSLGMLLKSGVVALKSLEIATPTIEDPRLRKQLLKVITEVAQGNSLAKSMENHTHLPRFFTKMIAVGEESGRLSEVLGEISRSYTQQIEADIGRISSLIEPVLILLLGVILGAIVLAILLPTFQITQVIR